MIIIRRGLKERNGTELREHLASFGGSLGCQWVLDLDHIKAHSVPKLAEEMKRQPKAINIDEESSNSSDEDIKATKAQMWLIKERSDCFAWCAICLWSFLSFVVGCFSLDVLFIVFWWIFKDGFYVLTTIKCFFINKSVS